MKKIKIYYWRGKPNFGDLLAPYIVNQISGLKVEFNDPNTPWFQSFINILVSIKHFGTIMKTDIAAIFRCNNKPTLYTVGSILGWARGNKNTSFWGSGFMNGWNGFSGGKVYAVRGLLSIKRLEGLGIKCSAYGDPALLLPLITKHEIVKRKKRRVAIIPHYVDYDLFAAKYNDVYDVIKLKSTDIMGVINSISSSEFVLSTSLHGIIVAHAYGVPALWIQRDKSIGGKDGFKFKDYFSSVLIPEYDGYTNFEELLSFSYEEMKMFMESKMRYALPSEDAVLNAQKSLLSAAPFDLKDEYKAYTNK